MSRLQEIVLAFGLALFAFAGGAQARESAVSVESTDAYKLLELEATVRPVPRASFDLLRSVIRDATVAASSVETPPTTRNDALNVFKAIQIALARHNFLQPVSPADWPYTLGIALTPLNLTPEKLAAQRASPDNARRAQYFDASRPFYYVDCDAGAQIFLAVAQRLGWDFRQVDVPHHTFVRWHLKSGETVNWDWIHGESLPDGSYLSGSALDRDLQLRGIYLRSYSTRESNAYYRGLIGSQAADKAQGIRLMEQALADGPQISMTQNNLAWAYATTPAIGRDKLDLALALSFASLSATPRDGNRLDTLACVLAARGHSRELASALEDFAVANPDVSNASNFLANKDRIKKGVPCQ